jgi:thymidine kinase
MWESLNLKFSKYPARMAVAQKMFELGLRISEDGKIYCGDLKISDSALAAAANVDRRVIKSTVDVIIADEAQFLTPVQIDGLRKLVDDEDIPVLCFGLRTDFLTHFFPGARRLMELADSITEIKTICECGRKATVNARFDENGKIVTEGDQVVLGGNDRYTALCHKCWVSRIKEQQ